MTAPVTFERWLRRASRRPIDLELLTWVTPVLVCYLVARQPDRIDVGMAAIAGLGLLIVAQRAPIRVLEVTLWLMPFQLPLLAFLYKHGAPRTLVRALSAGKEGALLGLLLAALVAARRRGRRTDALDRLGLLWIAGVALYGLLPAIAEVGAPRSMSIRLLGFRADVGFVAMFLACRHLPVTDVERARLRRTVLRAGLVLAGFGMYQWVAADSFRTFVLETLGVGGYYEQVLLVSGQDAAAAFQLLGGETLRVGSLFISPFEFADYLVIGIAMLLPELTQSRSSTRAWLGVGLLGFGIVVSGTRADLVAVAAMLAVTTLRPGLGTSQGRVRLALVVACAGLVLTPFALETRLSGAQDGDKSSSAHVEEIRSGIRHLVEHPRGSGLGTAPGIGQRYKVRGSLTSDNSFLQVGNELGLAMGLLNIALLATVMRHLARVPDGRAALLAGVGLITAGMLHHVFVSLAVSWAFWALAGLGVRPKDNSPDPPWDP